MAKIGLANKVKILLKDEKIKMLFNLKCKIIRFLNHFCFCDRHDDNCCGCIFKNCKKFPLNTVVDKLEKNLYI